VYEFDTVSETVVATYLMDEGIGGDPYTSPDGSKYILNFSITRVFCPCSHPHFSVV